MNIEKIVRELNQCTCGRTHASELKNVIIDSGITAETGKLLHDICFPNNILLVADKNTLSASDGIIPSLEKYGFKITFRMYDSLRTADLSEANAVAAHVAEVQAGGILSVGSGSLNDICRRAALCSDRRFAIFATAPSMDGFASGTSPLTDNNFKITYPARQPEIIIADTKILSAAPAELKCAGFGDIIAKYIALCDWRISSLLSGEYYCENIASLVRNAVKSVTALSDEISGNSEQAAGAVMEALVLTGIAMKLADSVRPASGAEHIISHFWEIKKLEHGLISDYHGKKVGVASLILSKLYHSIADGAEFDVCPDTPDWNDIYAAYGENFISDVKKVNSSTITEETSPEKIKLCEWQIKSIIREEIPTPNVLYDMMKRAGAAVALDEIAVPRELGINGVKYHSYMRHRMTLTRLIPMLGISINYSNFII